MNTFKGITFDGFKARTYDRETRCGLIVLSFLMSCVAFASTVYARFELNATLTTHVVFCLPTVLVGVLCAFICCTSSFRHPYAL